MLLLGVVVVGGSRVVVVVVRLLLLLLLRRLRRRIVVADAVRAETMVAVDIITTRITIIVVRERIDERVLM